MARITKKLVSDLTVQEYRQLWGLTLGRYGTMQSDLGFERTRPESKAQAIILSQAGRVLGWALLQPPEQGNNWWAGFFIRPNERRKGYGAQLMRYVQKSFSPVQVWAYDNVSAEFFKHFEDRIVCDKESRTWIDKVN
jgi:GNAT superfamily N-acetyltransferase